MNNLPLVYIIILIYNGKKWINKCLQSVRNTKYGNFKILILDNFSSDNSAGYVEKQFPFIYLIRNKKNYGFAEGNNIGIRYALEKGADYVVLLNQDTKVEPNWVSELVKVAENDIKVGILSPMQYDYEGTDLDRNFKILLDDAHEDNSLGFIETERVIGAGMLITRKVCQNVGLFDPLYFCYHEESDLCRRVLWHGYKIGIAKKSKIYHWHSLIQENGLSRKTKNLFRRNEFIYALKNPNKPFLIAMLGYIKWKVAAFVKKDGIFYGLGVFFVLILRQFPVFFYIPRIFIRKNKEMRRCICKQL